MLKMDLEYNQGILFARLKGDLNRKTSYKINNYLNPIIKKHKIKYLVYNLCELNNFDNIGIDSIIRSKCLIRHNKGKIRICQKDNRLYKYIHIPKIKNELEAFNMLEI